MPFYPPPEMLQAKECPPTPSPFIVFTFGLAIESIKEFGGASRKMKKKTKRKVKF
jgi:hypothetical protein